MTLISCLRSMLGAAHHTRANGPGKSFALMLSLCLAPVVAGCGSGGVTSPTRLTLAGTVWSGPFSDSGLGIGTMTLTFGLSEEAPGRWSLSRADLTIAGALRVLSRSSINAGEAVTLGLATASLNPDCDMLLNARAAGSQMQGNLRIGRCEPQGERVAEVRLSRR